jgi:hypothetical protein
VSTAALIALATGVVAWIGLDWWTRSGRDLPPLPWTEVAGTAALVAVVLAAGAPVRRWVRGDREQELDPLVAARTVVLAKTAVYGGAAVAGWYVAQLVTALPDPVGTRRRFLVLAALGTLFALGVVAGGLLVQRWCRVSPPEDEDDEREPPA